MVSENVQALQHPGFARMYLRFSAQAERRGAARHRDRLLAGLRGTVIEVGAGNGLNFAHYPATVTEVLAIEPDQTLREHAQVAAMASSVAVRVLNAQAGELPAADGVLDGVVMSLVLCTVPDPAQALREAARVLRPGGELRFYEHVRSAHPALGRAQDAVMPLWRRVAGGCEPNRDTTTTIIAAGFTIDSIDRFAFSPSPLLPGFAHVVGTAHTPTP